MRSKFLVFATKININNYSQQPILTNNELLRTNRSLSLESRSFHSVQDNRHVWTLLHNLQSKQMLPKKYACFLLNISNDSSEDFKKYKYIWDQANLKVAVDGSANFLFKKKLIYTADVVCGDFDSVNPELIQQLRCPRVSSQHQRYTRDDQHAQLNPKSTEQTSGSHHSLPQVIETPSPNETDFTKAVRVAIGKQSSTQFFIGLYCCDGSRMDHLFGLVNTLHVIKKNIFIINIKSNTLSWLLTQGIHIIQKPPGRELCSLIPFTGVTEVKTSGLEFNTDRAPLCFGGMISTSNICSEKFKNINIKTNKELLWSIDVNA